MDNRKNITDTLLNIESLIASHDNQLSSLQKDLKTYKSMLNDLLNNDNEYIQSSTEATKMAKQKNIVKQKVLKSPQSITVVDKIKDCQAQIKELKIALSDYLSQYVNMSGSNQITKPDGVVWQIVYTAHLSKKIN